MGSVTLKVLAQTLLKLKRSGLIMRQIIIRSPTGVEFCSTHLGFALAPTIRGLLRWAAVHVVEIEKAQARYDDAGRK
ncbi:winged helix-turn-helix transcriptional regulator [Paracoccus liaowanqingii]|uniref:winged helix-turn-helix transcriptional regulator n=1 Tax=Paracoccus liaowanqingii TaxID=2560053 RepID=UPI00143D882E